MLCTDTKNHGSLLIADDDLEDCTMIKEAFQEIKLFNKLHFVHDGEELMSFIKHSGQYADKAEYHLPRLILLDLNMPKKDGREVLREIKGNPIFRHIPVIVLTTSNSEDDVSYAYNFGVNSFIVKPTSFNSLVEIVKDFRRYWFETVELPQHH